MQKPSDHIVVLIEKTVEYILRFRIDKDFLEQNDIEFKSISKVLNEVDEEYLMLDAYQQGVWIPKKVIELEKVLIGENFDSDEDKDILKGTESATSD